MGRGAEGVPQQTAAVLAASVETMAEAEPPPLGSQCAPVLPARLPKSGCPTLIAALVFAKRTPGASAQPMRIPVQPSALCRPSATMWARGETDPTPPTCAPLYRPECSAGTAVTAQYRPWWMQPAWHSAGLCQREQARVIACGVNWAKRSCGGAGGGRGGGDLGLGSTSGQPLTRCAADNGGLHEGRLPGRKPAIGGLQCHQTGRNETEPTRLLWQPGSRPGRALRHGPATAGQARHHLPAPATWRSHGRPAGRRECCCRRGRRRPGK